MPKNIVLIGPYPPPLGGVSVHLTRLSSLLKENYILNSIDESRILKRERYNFRSLNVFKYFNILNKADFVHIHSGNLLFRFIHFLVATLLNKQTIITYHSYSLLRVRVIDKLIIKYASKVICVNEEIFNKFNQNKVLIKEAFLPPNILIEKDLPQDLIHWVNQRKLQGFSICSANAWRLKKHNGCDLYGLDLCIEAAKKLKEKGNKVAFIFVIGDNAGDLEIEVYRDLIDKYQLKDRFIIYNQSISFVKLIISSDIILRPTNTDGDALTVREALYFNRYVIASDIVKRPYGVKLFENRSSISLTYKIIESVNEIHQKANPSFEKHIHNEYLDYYKKCVYTFK